MTMRRGRSEESHQMQGITALLGEETGQISPAALCGPPQAGGSLRQTQRDEEREYRGELNQ